jgi:nitrogen fixation protein NifU and related proteins
VRGCLLCQASAALLRRAAPGASFAEVAQARAAAAAVLTGAAPPDGAWADLAAFTPVRAVRSRHTCVLLPFDALQAALVGAKG